MESGKKVSSFSKLIWYSFSEIFFTGSTLDILSPDCRRISCPILRSKTSLLEISKLSLPSIPKAAQMIEINISNINPNRYLGFPEKRFRLRSIVSIFYLQRLHFYLQSKRSVLKDRKVFSLSQR